MVLEVQLSQLGYLGRAFQEPEEVVMVVLVHVPQAEEARWEYQSTDLMLGKSVVLVLRGESGLRLHYRKVKVRIEMGDLSITQTDASTEMIYDQPPDHGIISAAIANAAALPATPSKGQENISLLDQQAAKKNTPAKTQFTFTCESDSTKGMLWPNDQSTSADGHYLNGTSPNGQNNLPPHQGQKGFSTQGTQTSPTMASQANQNGVQQPGAGQQLTQGKKPRRPPGRRYAIAAYERRKQQETNNRHHPPKEEDVWICEFCEYESIFGYPPEALIRQYEIKDRRERKRLAEKRRLLEKAKMKGRKGKKGNKNAAKNANMGSQSQHASSPQNYGQQSSDQTPVQNQGTQSEQYFVDDYDDDPVPMPAPSFQTPTKIPQPIASTTGQRVRSVRPGGSGHIRDGAIGIAA